MSNWVDCNGNRYDNQFIFDKLKSVYTDGENIYDIIVGTDSNANGRQYKFVTVLCLWKIGHGADYYYIPSYEPRSSFRGNNQKLRLFQEVAKSIEMADLIKEATGIEPTIHIDASPKDLREFSSEFSDQLKGYAISSGYRCEIKPNSWVASCAADKHSK